MRIWVVLLAALLVACAQQGPVCTKPYIPNGSTCCLDKNNDGLCDGTIIQSANLDCSLCPPQFVTQKEQVIVYKYVCANQSVMDSPGDCMQDVSSNATYFKPNTDQDEAYISAFTARPACRGKYQAAELHIASKQLPTKVTFQALNNPNSTFFDIGEVNGSQDLYYYIGFCRDCSKLTDAQLPATNAYMVHAWLQFDHKVLTRDIILDPTPDGDYGKKLCGS